MNIQKTLTLVGSYCKNHVHHLSKTGLVAVLMLASTATAEVEQNCVDRFMANNAIPGADNCAFQALTSTANLANYACTGPRGEAIITEYCGLVDDDQCDFKPAETPAGSIQLRDDAISTLVTPDVKRLFLNRYIGKLPPSLSAFSAAGSIDAMFIGIFDMTIPSLLGDIDSQFLGMGDFGGLINNLENCP